MALSVKDGSGALKSLKSTTDGGDEVPHHKAEQQGAWSMSITGSVAVTGTFFQATQPISATTLPLPAGAASETTLAAIAGYLDTEVGSIVTLLTAIGGYLDTEVGAIQTAVQTIDDPVGATGAATPAKVMLAGGSDGTNARALKTDTTGAVYVLLAGVGRVQHGTAKVIKNSGGDAAITLASVANGAARQSAKLDLGATHGEAYDVKATFEIAATPTAGNTIDLYWAPSSSATAGSDNPANVSGTDAAYSGYSANLTASLPQLQYIGSFVCTAQATGTVQAAVVGRFIPANRYGSLVVVNNSGAALHSTDTNQAVTLTPVESALAAT
jgi:hypothetical protein